MRLPAEARLALFLRTFGPLELLTPDGTRVEGAGAQSRPLLILALAALSPEGISRERVVRALWPGASRLRARAALKQHLYALRRASGVHDLIVGSPRLRVSPDNLRVDALEFEALMQQGQAVEAGTLLRGDVLEGWDAAPDSELGRLIADIRARFDARIALVRSARAIPGETEVGGLALAVAPPDPGDRELTESVRRMVRALVTLEPNPLAAAARVSACAFELAEAMHHAHAAGVPATRVANAAAPLLPLLHTSALARQLTQSSPGAPGYFTTVDWLHFGINRSTGLPGFAIERMLLDAPFIAAARHRIDWQVRLVLEAAARGGAPKIKVLAIGAGATRAVINASQHLPAGRLDVVVNDADPAALAQARTLLRGTAGAVTEIPGDCFAAVDQLEHHAAYDVILFDDYLDTVTHRDARWLLARAQPWRAARGSVACALSRPSVWHQLMHGLFGWARIERDHDAARGVIEGMATDAAARWDNDPYALAWLVAFTDRHVRETPPPPRA